MRNFPSLNFNLGPLSSLIISRDDEGDGEGDNEGEEDSDEEEHDDDELREEAPDKMDEFDEVEIGDGGEVYDEDQLAVEEVSCSELL